MLKQTTEANHCKKCGKVIGWTYIKCESCEKVRDSEIMDTKEKEFSFDKTKEEVPNLNFKSTLK